jgi:preprotein translocase subunit SecE
MADTKQKEKPAKPSWGQGLKEEFGKIIWPTKEAVAKQTFAVTVISIVVGLLIAMLDAVIQLGINGLISIGG